MPTLVVVSGLPAVGKSTIASRLAHELGAAYLRIDEYEPWDREPLVLDTAGVDVEECVASLRRRAGL